jgi:hypothetical protein
MFEQISALVKQYGQDAVINNPAIPNESNNAVLAEATNTITGGMQNMLAGGGLGDLISMFTGRRQTGGQGGGIGNLLKNPLVLMMIGHLISKLVTKYKMSPAQASQVSNNLIPNVLNGLVTRTASQEPSDNAFNLNDLIGSLTGGNIAGPNAGQGFNFQDLLTQFTGNSNDSAFDRDDIISQVTEKAQQNQEQNAREGQGLADLVRSFFN